MRGIAMAVLYFAFVIENQLAAREKPELHAQYKNRVVGAESVWLLLTFAVIFVGA